MIPIYVFSSSSMYMKLNIIINVKTHNIIYKNYTIFEISIKNKYIEMIFIYNIKYF